MNITESILNEVSTDAKQRAHLRGLLNLELRDEPGLATDLPRFRRIASRMASATAEQFGIKPFAIPTPKAVTAPAKTTPKVESSTSVPTVSRWVTKSVPSKPVIDPADVARRAKLALDAVAMEMVTIDDEQKPLIVEMFHADAAEDPKFGLDAEQVRRTFKRYVAAAEMPNVEPACELKFN